MMRQTESHQRRHSPYYGLSKPERSALYRRYIEARDQRERESHERRRIAFKEYLENAKFFNEAMDELRAKISRGIDPCKRQQP